ncbi:MAG TPA: hypothetical protein PKD54_13335 [Pirellulaceae bacterium]|nr:hypothetical protein [Pirellulaceae bacterium]
MLRASLMSVVVCMCVCDWTWAQPAIVSQDAVREKAIGWLKFNNKFGADSDFVRDMTEVIDESLADNMNINFFFGSNLMDAGKFMTMHVYGGAVLSFEMTAAQAAAMELDEFGVTVTTSGNMGKRLSSPSFELSDLTIEGGGTISGNTKFRGKVKCKATQKVDGSYALRVGYRAHQGVGQFQWLDAAPTTDGTEISFEFGPINKDDAEEVFEGPLVVLFDMVAVDESRGDIEILIHSNTVGRVLIVTDR